ncbi:MAG TPA: isoprenylcysteine carboxylmethyltransferase family protein [Stellaceae bacterium]|nr:isoprenylcysteine carboxylmethyltransferase family protein [Stellaceae bacterium]
MNLGIAFHLAIPALWLAWIAYWIVAARNAKPTRWREPVGAHLLHGLPLLFCAVLLVGPRWLPPALTARIAPAGPSLPLVGAIMVAAGLGFAIWARRHLGRNWSGRVEVKKDHALVRTGPYRLVRHPIYSGLLFALAGTALAIGEWRGAPALACAALGFFGRIRAEEAQMRRLFPEYERYRNQTAALIPFLL